jgi:hypothetical protein
MQAIDDAYKVMGVPTRKSQLLGQSSKKFDLQARSQNKKVSSGGTRQQQPIGEYRIKVLIQVAACFVWVKVVRVMDYCSNRRFYVYFILLDE